MNPENPLFVSKRDHWIYSRSTHGWQPASKGSDSDQHDRDSDKGGRVRRFDFEQLSGEKACQAECSDHTKDETDQGGSHSLNDYERQDVSTRGTQSHANA